MNRREFIVASSAVAASATLAIGSVATPSGQIEATMFCTTDEPWGVWVPGHVSNARFNEAALRLLEKDPDARENADDWFFERRWADDDAEEPEMVIIGEPEHLYMRKVRENDPELGDVYNKCSALDDGAIPITAVMY